MFQVVDIYRTDVQGKEVRRDGCMNGYLHELYVSNGHGHITSKRSLECLQRYTKCPGNAADRPASCRTSTTDPEYSLKRLSQRLHRPQSINARTIHWEERLHFLTFEIHPIQYASLPRCQTLQHPVPEPRQPVYAKAG